jgi:hypothetical protein
VFTATPYNVVPYDTNVKISSACDIGVGIYGNDCGNLILLDKVIVPYPGFG